MRYLMLIAAVVTLGGLTGCFNGSDDANTTTPSTFIGEVQTVVNIPNAQAETLEAIQVSQLTESLSDTDEPIAVMF